MQSDLSTRLDRMFINQDLFSFWCKLINLTLFIFLFKIYVGVVCALITFPVNLVLIQLFRLVAIIRTKQEKKLIRLFNHNTGKNNLHSVCSCQLIFHNC